MTPSGDGLSRMELFWRQRAQQNLQQWGLQDPQPTVLAMAEEVAEMAETFDLDPEVGPDAYRDPGAKLLVRLVVLGNEIRDYLDESAKDDEGNPLPPKDRPEIDVDVEEPPQLIAELDDLMALGYQLQSRMLADYGELRQFGQPQQRRRPMTEAPPEAEQADEEPENPWDDVEADGGDHE